MDDDELPDIPPPRLTHEEFHRWRKARRGTANPEVMTNPLWQWLVESRLNAFAANKHFDGPPSTSVGPMWCFERFGQSTTTLPDGRTILVGGEHEDYYDPDFYIYNDVVVVSPDEPPQIFGYPEDVFPPTDFHTATRTASRIILIGSLGYQQNRRPGQTQVLALELDSWIVSRITPRGTPPGWLYKHAAQLRRDGAGILVRGGQIQVNEQGDFLDNPDDWLLRFDGWVWERLTERHWTSFEFRRNDCRPSCLKSLRVSSWLKGMRMPTEMMEQLSELAGGVDPERQDDIADLYSPPVPHEMLTDDPHAHGEFQIRIEGVVVCYVEDLDGVRMTIQGELPRDVVEELRDDLTSKLWALERCPIECREIVA